MMRLVLYDTCVQWSTAVFLALIAGGAVRNGRFALPDVALLPPCVVMIAFGLFSECATPSPEKRITNSISVGAQRSVAR